MGREDDPEVQSTEEHLLWCEVCQTRAQSAEAEIQALRAALVKVAPALKKIKPASQRAMAKALSITI